MQLQQHPLSAAFPAMNSEEFQELKDSIMEIGVQNPITIYDGMVIDGWNRYRAANEVESECPSVQLDEWIDPVSFVKAQNKSRRHLLGGAWALIEVALSEWMPSSRPVKGALSAPLMATVQEMADSAGVSKRTIQQAKAVHENAAPEVLDAVKRGDIGLPKAAAIAKLPKEQQAEAIAKPLPKPEKPEAPVHVESEDKENSYTEADALRDQVLDLQAEVARLKLLVPDEADEGKAMQDQLVKDLRDAHALIDSLTASRNRFQAQHGEMVKQCEHYKRLMKKAGI